MFHPFSDVIPRTVEHILKLWADSWDLHSNTNLNGIQSIVGKNSWSYGITSKENIAVRLCRIDHAMMAHHLIFMKNNAHNPFFCSFISNILCIKLKIWAVLQLCSPSYMWGLAFYPRGKYLHYRIILLRRGVWADRTSSTLSNFIIIAVSLPNQKSERSCVYVLVVSIRPLTKKNFIWF